MSLEEFRSQSENPKEITTRLRKELADYAISGRASKFRGIIVSDVVWNELQKQNLSEDPKVLRVRGIEGHRAIRYSFYVQNDPSLPSGLDYALVHHTQKAYQEKFLGKIPKIMTDERRETRFQREGVKITELNPFDGMTRVERFTHSSYYHQVDYDDVLQEATKAVRGGQDIERTISDRFDHYTLINNAPEARWVGNIEFTETGRGSSFPTKYEFRYNPDMLESDKYVGKMFIQADLEVMDALSLHKKPGPFRIVGITKDGLGNRNIIVLPESESEDPMEFAKMAIKHFLPEEIFVAMGGKTPKELGAIRELPVREFWGNTSDSERAGRVQEYWNGHPENPEYFWEVSLVDSRANSWGFDVAKAKGKEEGDNVRAKYFPKEWQGWPETRQDRAFAAFAATL